MMSKFEAAGKSPTEKWSSELITPLVRLASAGVTGAITGGKTEITVF